MAALDWSGHDRGAGAGRPESLGYDRRLEARVFGNAQALSAQERRVPLLLQQSPHWTKRLHAFQKAFEANLKGRWKKSFALGPKGYFSKVRYQSGEKSRTILPVRR
jgi:hypothetical protein